MVVNSDIQIRMATANVKKLFGKRLRELRKQRGWSQEEFAYQVGLDRSYIGSVERGERNISLENICLIACALDLPPSQLFEQWDDSSSANHRRRNQNTERPRS
jgi:transcriptional regulator with XRE-family HTH domain